MLLTYAIYRQDPVFILGQTMGMSIYLRNLQMIHRQRLREASEAKPAAEPTAHEPGAHEPGGESRDGPVPRRLPQAFDLRPLGPPRRLRLAIRADPL